MTTTSDKIHIEQNQKRDERLHKARLSSEKVSVSSDSKWLKILEELFYHLNKETRCRIKLLQQDEAWEYKDIFSSLFFIGETWLECYRGAITFSEIEWFEFECETLPDFGFQVDFESEKGYVKIFGYRRTN